ncbi:MAG: hypothetical protein JW910_17560, partial [Anaerolineae bacterium]|nr:hypothetical protein [Anaerolineae bacterium]
MLPSPDGSRLWCQFCGVTRDDPAALAALEAYQADPPEPARYDPPGRGLDIELEDRLALDQAWESIQEGDPRSAALLLNATLSRRPDLADGWYLLSLTTDDPKLKLIYLNRALDAQPYHEYAWRDKGVMEGVIPAGEGTAADQPDPAGPVEAESETQACPTCGGALAFNIGLGTLVCSHCGYRPGDRIAASYRGGYDKLDNALLQRRFGFSREWRIGQRVLVCQNCHAQLT